MDLEFKFGLMELNIKDNGLMIKLMVKEYYIILMEIDTKEISINNVQMVKVLIFTKME